MGRTWEYRAASPSGDRSDCLDPSIADVEEWDCDCFAHMRKHCEELGNWEEGSNVQCMRDLVCQNDNLCDAWSEVNCANSLIEVFKAELEARAVDVLETDTALEETCASKGSV